MRFVTWNCRVGNYREKAARVVPLNPDVLVVPEAAREGPVACPLNGAQPVAPVASTPVPAAFPAVAAVFPESGAAVATADRH